MKHVLEHTKILVVICALFTVFLVAFGRTDLFSTLSPVVIGGIFFVLCILFIYRPILGFALFISALPYEIMSVVSDLVGVTVNPYQFLGVVLCVVMTWYVMRRHVIAVDVRATMVDVLVVGFVIMSGISLQWAQDSEVALRQTIIVGSFAILYLVARFFTSTYARVMHVLPIVVVSGWMTSLYAIVQNVLFLHGGMHQEVMPGRPNAFFAEPDWLGIYLVFVFATCVTYLYYNAHYKHHWRFFDIILWGITVTVMVATILTVARSAWLGLVAVSAVYLLTLFLMRTYKMFAQHALWIGSVTAVSGCIALFVPITNFALDNRVQSTATGLQEITVSCSTYDAGVQVTHMRQIDSAADLLSLGCQHIDLEEIEREKQSGHTVVTVMRTDPNIAVRAHTYGRVIDLVRARPFTGYGWGSSGALLGTDEHGTPLNASNIFLETAVSIGVIGAGILAILCFVIMLRSIHVLRGAHDVVMRSVALFGLLGLTAIVIPNLFNAGLFMGFVWVYMAMVAILCKKV